MNDLETMNISNSPYQFSAIAPENLESSEYTLVTIACDTSGSVGSFEKDLEKTLDSIVEACKKSPRAENLLLRVVIFNSNVKEVHGFIDLQNVKPYKLSCFGATSLFDATFLSIEATKDYSKKLRDMDFSVNSILFIVTDGEDNNSTYTPKTIKNSIENLIKKEEVDSMITVLVGVNDNGNLNNYLQDFKKDAGLTQYVSLGEATPQKLAKLGNFVSKSISSQSQSLTGGTSVSTADLTL